MQPSLSDAEAVRLLFRFALESSAVAALAFLLLRYGLWALLRSSGGTRLWFGVGFLALFVVVQAVDRWQYFHRPVVSFFPFSRFAMYQTGTPAEAVHVYRMTDGKGNEVNPTQVLSAIGVPSLSSKFAWISSAAASSTPEDRRWAREELEAYARSMKRISERRGSSFPDSLILWLDRHPVGEKANEDTSYRTPLLRVRSTLSEP
jgi:hypothetical protein